MPRDARRSQPDVRPAATRLARPARDVGLDHDQLADARRIDTAAHVRDGAERLVAHDPGVGRRDALAPEHAQVRSAQSHAVHPDTDLALPYLGLGDLVRHDLAGLHQERR